MSEPEDYWSRRVKDAWFFAALTVSTVAMVWLFWPYLYVMLFAAVTVAVCWPVYKRILKWCGGRALVASVIATLMLGLLVFVPLAAVLWLFALEVQDVSQQAIELVQSGELERWVDGILRVQPPDWLDPFLPELPSLPAAAEGEEAKGVQQLLARFSSIDESFMQTITDAALSGLRFAGAEIPGIISAAVDLSLNSVIYVFAVITLFVQGPAVLDAIKRLSPMHDEYEERLFKVFGEFSQNLVVGSLATAGIQGVVAGIGYAVAGMNNVIFLAILTGIGSFVPVVGTVVVWLPVVIYLVAIQHYGLAIFLGLWCLIVVGTIDNVLKPLFMRGSADIHPLLIFLAVFGGLYWMNIAGLLIGPVIVAFFLALYAIYVEDYLGEQPLVAETARPNFAMRTLAYWARKVSGFMERTGRASQAEQALRAADALDGKHTAEELVAQHEADAAVSEIPPSADEAGRGGPPDEPERES